ncbi:hypothetical protein GCM10020000_77660 [Streptomyces olivoverticillatus]
MLDEPGAGDSAETALGPPVQHEAGHDAAAGEGFVQQGLEVAGCPTLLGLGTTRQALRGGRVIRRLRGRIGGYGVATWSGFESGAFIVPGLVGLARQAASGRAHHLVAVQQLVSLVMDRPIRQSLGGRGPLVQARAAGLTTFASSPLHGGELIDLVTPELVEFIRPGLSPAAACLLVAANPEPGRRPPLSQQFWALG